MGYGVICKLCSAPTSIEDERKNSAKGLKRSAEAMLEHPARKFKNINAGDPVLIPLSKVDRGSLDSI